MEYLTGKEGLEAEFSRIVRDHAQNLHLLALRITKCEQVAKDVVQDAFLKLWENRDQFDKLARARITKNPISH